MMGDIGKLYVVARLPQRVQAFLVELFLLGMNVNLA
jgi:hypothetical protein